MERITVSIDEKLALEFDTWAAQRGYDNRSEAFRDMVRGELDRQRIREQPDGPCVACLSYVFNHHERDLAERLTGLHHEHHDLTLSTTHVHLDHENCLETVLLRGPIKSVRKFSDAVCAQRGVHHGQLNVISVEMHHRHSHPGARDSHVHLKPST